MVPNLRKYPLKFKVGLRKNVSLFRTWRAFYGSDGNHLGENSTYDDYESYYGAHWRYVNKIVIHPDFDETTYQYNFAMVKFDRALQFDTWAVQPICLPSACNVTCQGGDIAEIAGYGEYFETGNRLFLSVIIF